MSMVLLKTNPALLTQGDITHLTLIAGIAVPARLCLHTFNLAPGARLPVRNVHQLVYRRGLAVPRSTGLPRGILGQIDESRGWGFGSNLEMGAWRQHEVG